MKTCCIVTVLCCLFSLVSISQRTFQIDIGKDENLSFVKTIVAQNEDLIVNGFNGNSILSRITSNGTVNWSKLFDFYATGIAPTNDNGFILSSSEGSSVNLIKCDSNGIVRWAKKVNSESFLFNGINVIFQSRKGDYYFSGGDFYNNIQLIKFDIEGNLIWNKCFTEPSLDYGLSPITISETKNSNFLLSISVVGCEFYCTHLDFAKFDSNGNIHGSRLVTPNSNDSPVPLLINNSNGFFTILRSGIKYAYANIDLNQNSIKCIVFPHDIFSLQFFAKSNHLNEIKNNPLNEGYGFALVRNDWTLFRAYNNFKKQSIRLEKYDELGRICPAYSYPTLNMNTDTIIFSLPRINFDYFYNNITVTDTIIKSKKINEGSTICEGTAPDFAKYSSNLSQNKSNKSLQLYPNPTINFITINYQSERNQSAQIQIFSATGKLLSEEKINLFIGENARSINVSNFLAGAYFLKLNTQTEQQNFRFIKE